MMRSISTKLILAFFSIGIVSVAILSFMARWNTRTEFIQFLSDQTDTDVLSELSEYHLVNGSWTGVEEVVRQKPHDNYGPGPGYGSPPRSFILTDEQGVVLTAGGGYGTGDRLSEADRLASTPITENDIVVGYYVPIRKPYEGQPRELEFIERVNRMLLYGSVIGAVITLLLGIFLSRTITRPIRELTQATHAVSEGNLLQRVTVRSNDELGELARAFNKMSAELSRSVNARKQMTADVAHELRTPLSLILGHAEAVHDGVLPPTRENFEIVREEAVRLEHLVNDLRILSLADAGELTINLQTIEPERLINDVASRYQVETQKKKIPITVDAAPHLPSLEADPGRMTQVLTNIMDNALRHTPEGGKIVLSTKQAGNVIEISVQDGGPGVSPEDLDRIFERFYRSDSARQRDADFPGGSGLGLAIAKSIVQAHGGQISAESEAGKGLRVVIHLPVVNDLAK